MYEEYFGFREEPFSLTPDPAFLYFSRQHRLAYSLLEYGVLKQAGFTVITGDVGCGKTTLIRRLLDELKLQVTIGLIDNTHPRLTNLAEWMAMAFGLVYKSRDPVELYDAFVQFLLAEHSANRRAILVIDEAQNLDAASLEELRTLSNINVGKYQVLQIILVGQPELKTTLSRPELRQFAQRVVAHYDLKAFSEDETLSYIHHRLQHAGGHSEIFSLDACRLIYRQSGGVPRLINLLCGTALVYAYAEEARQVSRDLVEIVLNDGAAGFSLGARAATPIVDHVPEFQPEPGRAALPTEPQYPTRILSVEYNVIPSVDTKQPFSNRVKRKR